MNIKKLLVDSFEKTPKTITLNFSHMLEKCRISEFNLIRFVVLSQQQSEPDKHKSKEYWYIAQGEGLLWINNEKAKVMKGETYFFDSFDVHHILNTSPCEDLEILSIWW